ncbi:hypothetical protein BCR44DRAFT_272767 [Catenaria anguillulae PL171]|uniref:Uncharacterized protein n=1 Tax=Catenaria anguillulae PL171 TaxID=765915 RepID=A0A1Y2H5C7_9FUNG|nr:hypothetical protein BCR44DRAFT_272767 [Catenaria anguillulae PL171]
MAPQRSQFVSFCLLFAYFTALPTRITSHRVPVLLVEVGSGTTLLPTLLAAAAANTPSTASGSLTSEIQRIKHAYDIVIRDAEHLAYFGAFERIHLTQSTSTLDEQRPWTRATLPERFGSDPCRECKYQLQTSDTKFCVVCGAWPARD